MLDKQVKLYSTWFYVGNIPFAPGSMASLVGALIYMALYHHPFLLMVLLLIILILGFKVSGRMEEILKEKDPSCIVIDEVAGVMIALLFLPLNLSVMITAFFLFRAFDMFKPYPINKFEEMDGGRGVMMDDVIAGIYTNITMHIAIRWAGIV